jgi:hypothetical protein
MVDRRPLTTANLFRDTARLAKILAAQRGTTMVSLLDGILTPALTKLEREDGPSRLGPAGRNMTRRTSPD